MKSRYRNRAAAVGAGAERSGQVSPLPVGPTAPFFHITRYPRPMSRGVNPKRRDVRQRACVSAKSQRFVVPSLLSIDLSRGVKPPAIVGRGVLMLTRASAAMLAAPHTRVVWRRTGH